MAIPSDDFEKRPLTKEEQQIINDVMAAARQANETAVERPNVPNARGAGRQNQR